MDSYSLYHQGSPEWCLLLCLRVGVLNFEVKLPGFKFHLLISSWSYASYWISLSRNIFVYVQSSSCMWRRQWHPTPVLLPGKSHGWRSLVGCSLWGRWELGTTEWLHFHFSLSCIGEGNGNPLQCSCLENPRDGGALWAAISGVAQSRTRLKQLSISSSSSSCMGLTLNLVPCCCCLEIIDYFWTQGPAFSFCTGPCNYLVGPIAELWYPCAKSR